MSFGMKTERGEVRVGGGRWANDEMKPDRRLGSTLQASMRGIPHQPHA
jgi:hypothetical protein